MPFYFHIVTLLCISSLPVIFINSINCEDVEAGYGKKFDVGTEVQPTQSTLIKRGFSGIFWYHIKSKRDQIRNLSPQCLTQLIETSDLIDSDEPQAVKLMTASSHLPNKMFQMSYSDFEGYDLCLSLESTHYCQFSVLPKKMNFYPHWFLKEFNNTIHIGYCLPQSCLPNEIDGLITSILQSYDWEKVYFHGCLTESTFRSRLTKANTSQLVSLIFLCGIMSLVGISSLMHYLGFYHEANTIRFTWLRHFALQQTHRALICFQVRKRINFIDYLRIFCTSVALPYHVTIIVIAYKFIYIVESVDTAQYYVTKWRFQPMNSDWIIGILIHLGATTILTHLWPQIKPNTSFKTYALLFVKKFVLYWPIMIVVIAMEIVLPLLGSGPVYTYHTQWRSDICASNWFYTLLHIQNLQKTLDVCYIIFWTFNAEVHLFIITLILIYLYKTRPLIASFVNWMIIFIGLAITFHIYYSNKFTYRFIGYKHEHWENFENFITRTFFATENHIFTHSLSFMVNVRYLMNPRPSQEIKKVVFWLISITLSLLATAVAYSSGILNILKLEMAPFWNAIHAVAAKVIISLGWSWLGWCNFHHARVTELLVEGAKDEVTADQRNVLYKLIFIASRTYIFSHWIVFSWFFSRKTKIFIDFTFFLDTIFLTVIGFLSGLIFYYMFLGPYENIISALKYRKFGKHV